MSEIVNRATRIGLLVPAGNITFEPDFAAAVPEGVTLHAHRLQHKNSAGGEDAQFMEDINSGLSAAASILSMANVKIMAYGFTAATFYNGIESARELEKIITKAGGTKSVVPSLSLLDALVHLNAKRISIVTPYPSWNNEVLRKFMEEADYEILSFVGDNRPFSEASKNYMWHQKPGEIVEFITRNCHPQAECVLAPCTAWRTYEVVDKIEEILKIPVVSANQATIWKVFRELQLNPAGRAGALMRP